MRVRRPRRLVARTAAGAAAADADAERSARRVLTAPQVLVSGLALVLAATYALGALAGRPVATPGEVPAFDMEAVATVSREVRFVVVDEAGLERPGYAEVALPREQADDVGARLVAALAALRADRVERGAWPPSVPAPDAFVYELERRTVAVVDVAVPAVGGGVAVAQELAALRSIVATARAEAAADEVRITVAGAPARSLWGHVALPVAGD
ncbi:MAG: hypothetical protein P1P87_15720 [Trueperaceae bacterium]|nr:hypothetical protein [Trueperaceae bacterium]